MPTILEDGRIGQAGGSGSAFYHTHRSLPSTSSSTSTVASSATSPISEEKTHLSSSASTSFTNSVIDDDCLVITTAGEAERDQIDPKPWQRFVARFFFLTAIVPCILTIWASRIQFSTLATSTLTTELSAFKIVLVCLIIAIEFVWSIDALLLAFVKAPTMWVRGRPRIRLLGDNVPSVDVILPVCNERLDIIQDTVRATLNIDYPRHRFRVIVSDDGANPKLQAWVAQHAEASGVPNLHYTARVKSGPAGYKAGNLNHAMKVADGLAGGSAEFVAGLDADMIPERRWLRAVAAHIVRDSKLALVCPAQLFYNTPKNDPLYQSSAINWLCLDMIRDHAGAGWNLGSGWIVRREAVDDIGGFPTDCLVEDICSSMLMLANGWKTAYIPEGLQYGLVPETYVSHIKQFVRWYIGGCQMAIRFRGYLARSRMRNMPLVVRLLGLSNAMSVHIKPHLATVGLLVTPCVFWSGSPLIYWSDHTQMLLLLRIHCAIVITRWLHDCHLAVLAGYRTVMMDACLIRYMSPYYTTAWARAFVLPAWLGGKVTGFTATGSIANSMHERSAARRAPLSRRLRHHILAEGGVWVQLLVVITFLLGAALRVCHIFLPSWLRGDTSTGAMWKELLQTVAWPSHPWFPTVLACLTPIRYAVFPPDVPDREKLMGKTGKNGARYAKPEAKAGSFSVFGLEFTQLYTLFVMYVAAVFVGSWWL